MEHVDTKTVGQFEVATYQGGGLTLEMLKSLNAPKDAEFLPAKVGDESGKVLWRFDKNRHQGAFAWLRIIDDEAIIAYASRTQLFESSLFGIFLTCRSCATRRAVRSTKADAAHRRWSS